MKILNKKILIVLITLFSSVFVCTGGYLIKNKFFNAPAQATQLSTPNVTTETPNQEHQIEPTADQEPTVGEIKTIKFYYATDEKSATLTQDVLVNSDNDVTLTFPDIPTVTRNGITYTGYKWSTGKGKFSANETATLPYWAVSIGVMAYYTANGNQKISYSESTSRTINFYGNSTSSTTVSQSGTNYYDGAYEVYLYTLAHPAYDKDDATITSTTYDGSVTAPKTATKPSGVSSNATVYGWSSTGSSSSKSIIASAGESFTPKQTSYYAVWKDTETSGGVSSTENVTGSSINFYTTSTSSAWKTVTQTGTRTKTSAQYETTYYYNYQGTEISHSSSKTADESTTQPVYDDITPGTPSRDGYTFYGWTTSSSKPSSLSAANCVTASSFNPGSNRNYYAVWKKSTSARWTDYSNYTTATVNYNWNEGTGSPNSTTMQIQRDTHYPAYDRYDWITQEITQQPAADNYNYKGSVTLPSSGTRTGYSLEGWNLGTTSGTSYDLGATFSFSDASSYESSYTFYARWKINNYTITANANGGNIPSSSGWTGSGNEVTKSVQYGSAYGTLPQDPTRDGYTFDGWWTNTSGGDRVSAETVCGGSAETFYAHWRKNITNGLTITLSKDSFVYNGSQQTPTVTIMDGGTALTDADFELSYQGDRVNVSGSPVVITIKGKGNYAGSTTKTYTITQKPIDSSDIEITGVEDKLFTGSAITQSVVVKDKTRGVTLGSGTDYSVSYRNNSIVTTEAVCIVSGLNNYGGSKEITFTIRSSEIADDMVSLQYASTTYDGSEKQPTVSVVDHGMTLRLGDDYTVSYSDNKNAGEATVVVEGAGNYSGRVEKHFTISAKSIAGADIVLKQPIPTQYYTGEGIKPQFVLHDNTIGVDLVIDVDYSVKYSNNVEVTSEGNLAKIEISGTNNYTGTKIENFVIDKQDISGYTVVLDNNTFNYDAKNHLPNVTAVQTLDGKTLGTDAYDVEFRTVLADAGSKITEAKNVGVYYVYVSGKGKYKGSTSTQFEIVAGNFASASVTIGETNFTYNGQIRGPQSKNDIVVHLNGVDVALEEFSYSIHASTPDGALAQDVKNVGEYYVVVEPIGNNYTGSASVKFSILKASLYGAQVSYTESVEYFFNNANQHPTVSAVNIKAGGNNQYLQANFDADLSELNIVYEQNVSFVGEHKITISAKSGNFDGELELTYSVKAKQIDASKLGLGADSPITIQGWQEKFVYNREQHTQNLTLVDSAANYTLVLNKDYSIAYDNNTNATYEGSKAKLILTLKGNYALTGADNKTLEFDIEQAEVNSITIETATFTFDRNEHKPQPSAYTANSLTLLGSEFSVEYYFKPFNSGDVAYSKATNCHDAGNYQVQIVLTGEHSNFKLAGDITYPTYVINKAVVSFASLKQSSVTYNRNAFTIEIDSVMAGDVELNGVDGTAEYAVQYYRGSDTTTDFTNAGEIKVSITALTGNFEGSYNLTFTIKQKDIGELDVKYYIVGEPRTELNGDQIYLGQEVEPELKFDEYTLTKTGPEEYSFSVYYLDQSGDRVSGQSATVHEYTIEVLGKGNYSGTVTEKYKVVPAVFDDAHIEVTLRDSNKKYYYTGGEVELDPANDLKVIYTGDNGDETELTYKPEFTQGEMKGFYTLLKGKVVLRGEDGEEIGKEETEIPTGYLNNKEAGTASVFLTGDTQNFEYGYVVFNFKIEKINTNISAVIQEGQTFVYNGSEQEAQVVVSWDKKPLKANEDYTLEYSDHTNAGQATVVVKSKGNFDFSNITLHYTIAPRSIKNIYEDGQNVQISVTQSNIYNAQEQRPNISLRYNNQELVLTTDYSVKFLCAGVDNTDFTNIGEITVQITGNINFADTVEFTYTIEKATINQFEISENSATFDFDTHQPTVTVNSADVGGAVESKAYTISYSKTTIGGDETEMDWINAGIVTVTISLTDNSNFVLQEGIKTLTFTIYQRNISDVDVGELGSYGFTGYEIKPEISLTYNANALVKDKDYQATYSNNTSRGTGRIDVVGLGNFTGSLQTITFEIAGKDISGVNPDIVIQSLSNHIFDAQKHQETVIIKDNGRSGYALVQDVDFEVEYSTDDFVNVAEITVTITGINDYGGTKELTYSITPRPFNAEEVSITADEIDLTYSGADIIPTLELSFNLNGRYVLTKGDNVSDYDCQIINPLDAKNQGKKVITINFGHNFSGNTTYEYTILQRTIDKQYLDTSALQNVTYDGKPHKLEVTCQGILTNEDFEVVYYRDGQPISADDDFVNVGRITVEIKGKNNFTGTLAPEGYDILALKLKSGEGSNFVVSGVEDEYTFNGYTDENSILNTILSSISVMVNGELPLTLNENLFKISNTADFVNVGEKTILFEARQNFEGQFEVKITIKAKELDRSMLTTTVESQYTYTGNNIEPEIGLKYNELTLSKRNDYSVVYANQLNATNGGTKASITITARPNSNYSGSFVIEFTILKADPTVNVFLPLNDQYGKTIHHFIGDDPSLIELELKDSTSGTIKITTKTLLVFGANECSWEFTPTDTNNYNSKTGTITINGEKISATSTFVPEGVKNTYYTFEYFDMANFKIVVTFMKGEPQTLSTGFKITLNGTTISGTVLTNVNVTAGYEMQAGNYTLTISYTDETDTTVTTTMKVVVNQIKLRATIDEIGLSNLKDGDKQTGDYIVELFDKNNPTLQEIVTRHPFDELVVVTYKNLTTNQTLSSFSGSGDWWQMEIRVNNDNFFMDKTTFDFYIKPLTLASSIDWLHAESENGFASGVKLVVEMVEDKAYIKQLVGDIYSKLKNVNCLYKIYFENEDGEIVSQADYVVIIDTKQFSGYLLFNTTNGQAQVVTNDGSELKMVVDDFVTLVISTELKQENIYLKYLWLIPIALFLIILIFIISAIKRKKKQKKLIESLNKQHIAESEPKQDNPSKN